MCVGEKEVIKLVVIVVMVLLRCVDLKGGLANKVVVVVVVKNEGR